ncbi:MAG: Fur family transcriptional regulator, ferric uptake regulator [Gaiellaceae bacterium]|jgi:Fur family ferric uptake transcriptional regulator|nr:Fur family transcriptional regulator, ferric uptake regulator [Gaiellaceae bacterium]
MVRRNTRQRRLLAELVASRQHAFTAEELWAAARAGSAPVSLATVYRTLALLEADELVRRLDRGRFIACEPGHHHHLVCVTCGAVEETDLCAAPPVTEVQRRHGFVVQRHDADLYGVCERCA